MLEAVAVVIAQNIEDEHLLSNDAMQVRIVIFLYLDQLFCKFIFGG
jgi:hypothetical protein